MTTTVEQFRSGNFIQHGEPAKETERILQRALQIIDNVDCTGIAPAYRTGKRVMFAAGMDGYTLLETDDPVTAEIVTLLWNHCRDQKGIAQKLAKILKVTIR